MTKREAAIVSAYTGILLGDMGDMCRFIDEIMGRPVFTHELADESIVKEIKEKSKPYFLKLSDSLTESTK